MTISLLSLLKRVPPSVEARVKAARDRSRNVLREALRTECRLVMRGADDADERTSLAQVPVEVWAGYPEVLKTISFPDDLEQILLLTRYRRSLIDVAVGGSQLVNLHGEMSRLPGAEEWVLDSVEVLHHSSRWAAEMLKRLEKQDPVGTVLAVNEDILGTYTFDATSTDEMVPNRAVIGLYWGVVGLVSDWLGCSVEDLTIVVLTHELAHAYTQLGADIEGRRWPSKAFAQVEVDLKEGLAQYYTARALVRVQHRFPGALETFSALLPKQSDPYRKFEPWRDTKSPEAVRRAMIEMRRSGEGDLKKFEERLDKAAIELQPLRESLFQ